MEHRPIVKINGVNAKCNIIQAMLLLLPVYHQRSYCIFVCSQANCHTGPLPCAAAKWYQIDP